MDSVADPDSLGNHGNNNNGNNTGNHGNISSDRGNTTTEKDSER